MSFESNEWRHFSLAPGTYSAARTVTISDTTPGATTYYAIGAARTAPSTVYNGPITVSSTETIQATAAADNYLNSTVATAAYNIGSNPTAEWTWMGGSSTTLTNCSNANVWGQPGVYGALGTPASVNAPGARRSAGTWTDHSGNLWLFGGSGYDAQGNYGYLNDLWQYSLDGTPAVLPLSPAAMPSFSLAAGTYASAQTLTISDQTAIAVIF